MKPFRIILIIAFLALLIAYSLSSPISKGKKRLLQKTVKKGASATVKTTLSTGILAGIFTLFDSIFGTNTASDSGAVHVDVTIPESASSLPLIIIASVLLIIFGILGLCIRAYFVVKAKKHRRETNNAWRRNNTRRRRHPEPHVDIEMKDMNPPPTQ